MGPVEQTLRTARDKIKDKKNWTKGKYARDSTGRECLMFSDEAKCFCAEGAIIVSRPPYCTERIRIAIDKILEEVTGNASIVGFNDKNEHHVVIASFGLAISRAKSRGI